MPSSAVWGRSVVELPEEQKMSGIISWWAYEGASLDPAWQHAAFSGAAGPPWTCRGWAAAIWLPALLSLPVSHSGAPLPPALNTVLAVPHVSACLSTPALVEAWSLLSLQHCGGWHVATAASTSSLSFATPLLYLHGRAWGWMVGFPAFPPSCCFSNMHLTLQSNCFPCINSQALALIDFAYDWIAHSLSAS